MAKRPGFDDFALIGFVASAAAILALAAADYWASSHQVRAAEWVSHTHEVRASIANARSDLVQAFSERDEPSTQRFASMALQTELARLRVLMRDNPDQVRRVAEIESAVMVPGLQRDGVRSALASLSTLDGEELRLLDERVRDEERTLTWFHLTSAVAILVMLLVLFVLYVLEERRRSERDALLRSEQRLLLMTQNVREYAIFMLDRAGRIATWNAGAERIMGWSADEITGRHFSRFYSDDVPNAEIDAKLEAAAAQGRYTEEGWRVRKDGSRFWANVLITALHEDTGEVQGFAEVTRDLTERKHNEDALSAEVTQRRLAEEALREMIAALETVVADRTGLLEAAILEVSEAKRQLEDIAQRDPLTGLPNRRLLIDRLKQATSAARRRGRSVGVLFVDLDRFKEINDTRGHDAGDVVLKEVARRLSSCVREEDTVAREGGDEFVMVLPDLEAPGDAMRVADKVLIELAKPMEVGGTHVSLTLSIGVSHYPRDATDIEELIKHADEAMYSAKNAGRNTIRSFT